LQSTTGESEMEEANVRAANKSMTPGKAVDDQNQKKCGYLSSSRGERVHAGIVQSMTREEFM
jgi:hypothetical protein